MTWDNSAWGRKWSAPAKINLMLRVTGQRDDGYHYLQTVFQLLDLCDKITFHPTDDNSIYLKKPLPDVPEATDLSLRAAKLLQQESGCQHGVCIEVEKNLPMGGGIGGGSSDAATTLLVLNQLWNIGFSSEKLQQLGLKLGADVPVFVGGHAAWAEGVGEKLTQIKLKEQWLVIIKPDCHVNTGEIFSHKDLTRNSKSIKIADFLTGQCQNDCFDVVSDLYPPVKKALFELSKFSPARLTGTGACVFAQFDSKAEAEHAYQALQKNWQTYLTKGLNKSPLLVEMESFKS